MLIQIFLQIANNDMARLKNCNNKNIKNKNIIILHQLILYNLGLFNIISSLVPSLRDERVSSRRVRPDRAEMKNKHVRTSHGAGRGERRGVALRATSYEPRVMSYEILRATTGVYN